MTARSRPAVYFNIGADGTISYDPALEGILSGPGSNALTVNGASITLDATAEMAKIKKE